MPTLTLPKPHPAQQRVMDEAKRFNVVCCGRRWGKTALGSYAGCVGLNRLDNGTTQECFGPPRELADVREL